jgi:hypothetical protein
VVENAIACLNLAVELLEDLVERQGIGEVRGYACADFLVAQLSMTVERLEALRRRLAEAEDAA